MDNNGKIPVLLITYVYDEDTGKLTVIMRIIYF